MPSTAEPAPFGFTPNRARRELAIDLELMPPVEPPPVAVNLERQPARLGELPDADRA